MLNHQDRIKRIRENANDIEFVKGLLNKPREMAVLKLLEMIDLVNKECVVQYYLKTLPVYFVYAEVNKICLEKVKEILRKLKNHPLFGRYQSLFEEWEARFENLCSSRRGTFLTRMEAGRGSRKLLGYTDLDFFVVLQKWLKYHKLHKYSYFFANMTYQEFTNLSERSMYDIENRVGLLSITTGARGTIIRRMDEELNNRIEKLTSFLNISFDNSEDVGKILNYLKKILHTPIWKRSELPALLEKIITLVIEAILVEDSATTNENVDLAIRVLKSAYSCYFFSHTQKSKFNTLRCRLRGIEKELNTRTQSPAHVSNQSPEDILLLENLKKIELALMQLIQ